MKNIFHAVAVSSMIIAMYAEPVTPQASSEGQTAVMAPNPEYQMNAIGRFFWGDHYRDSWSVQATFKVLDFSTFAGGLTVEGAGRAGAQTKRLNFKGSDGRRYAFRSIDKDPSVILPEQYRTTIAADIVQDQISSSHPAGVLITDRLEEALGIIHAKPHVFLMPDDPALGEYRDDFANILGQMVELPGDHFTDAAIFAGADEVGDGNIAFNKSQASPAERVHTAELIKARLFDLIIGDWDRHRWQYRYVKMNRDPRWIPVPEDRDQAFSKLDGILPSRAHYMAPQTIGFEKKYPNMYNLHYNGREVDRRFLVEAEQTVWDSVAAYVQNTLSDTVIEDAVKQLPPEMYAIDGAELEGKLKARRDEIDEAARSFYLLLARQVQIHMTDVAETATVKHTDGIVEISIADNSTRKVYFRRRFKPSETKEIRLRLHAGNDMVIVEGGSKLPIKLRIIGGPGADELHYVTNTGNVTFYDQHGSAQVSGAVGASRKIVRKPYDDWVFSPENAHMPLDWGHRVMPQAILGFSPDFGLMAGYSLNRINYGFRRDPYASSIRGGLALTTQGKFHLPFYADFYRENTRVQGQLFAQASQLGIVRFFGFGNQSSKEASSNFYKVDRLEVIAEPTIGTTIGKKRKFMDGPVEVSRAPISFQTGVSVIYSNTSNEDEKFIGTLPGLYGTGSFGQLGAVVRLEYESRYIVKNPTKGASLAIVGAVYPKVWDVNEAYGYVDAAGAVFLATPSKLRPVLALRAGGRKLWGDFPFFHSAFVGGPWSVRGYDLGRFAGDASVFAGGDFRFRLFHPRILSISDFGLLAFADAGRVYIDGSSPGDWHVGYGGGVWFSVIGPQNTLSLSLAKGDETNFFYFMYGFAF